MSKDAIIKILITIIALHDYCADGIYMALAYNQPYDHRDTDPYDLAFVGIDFPVDSNRGSGGNHCVCC